MPKPQVDRGAGTVGGCFVCGDSTATGVSGGVSVAAICSWGRGLFGLLPSATICAGMVCSCCWTSVISKSTATTDGCEAVNVSSSFLRCLLQFFELFPQFGPLRIGDHGFRHLLLLCGSLGSALSGELGGGARPRPSPQFAILCSLLRESRSLAACSANLACFTACSRPQSCTYLLWECQKSIRRSACR